MSSNFGLTSSSGTVILSLEMMSCSVATTTRARSPPLAVLLGWVQVRDGYRSQRSHDQALGTDRDRHHDHGALRHVAVVQKKYAEQAKGALGSPSVLTMGTGPYRPQDLKVSTGVSLIRNENYWRAKPPVKQLTLTTIPSDSSRLLAAESHQLDGTFEVPLQSAKQWSSISGYTTGFQDNLWWAWISLDTSTPPLDDVHVRRALAYLVDRQGLVDSLLGGHGEPANTIPAPEQWGSFLPADQVREQYAQLPTYTYDPERAKAELKQSRYQNGFTITLRANGQYQRTVSAAEALAQAAKPLGININVVQLPQRTF